jgi:hypothetical protein
MPALQSTVILFSCLQDFLTHLKAAHRNISKKKDCRLVLDLLQNGNKIFPRLALFDTNQENQLPALK